MLAGGSRFDVFAGEIRTARAMIAGGERFEQADIDQFPPGAPGLECKYCMYWWAEGITAELPEL
jgi:basic membrane protein A